MEWWAWLILDIVILGDAALIFVIIINLIPSKFFEEDKS